MKPAKPRADARIRSLARQMADVALARKDLTSAEVLASMVALLAATAASTVLPGHEADVLDSVVCQVQDQYAEALAKKAMRAAQR